jgi:hypothetical protein
MAKDFSLFLSLSLSLTLTLTKSLSSVSEFGTWHIWSIVFIYIYILKLHRVGDKARGKDEGRAEGRAEGGAECRTKGFKRKRCDTDFINF